MNSEKLLVQHNTCDVLLNIICLVTAQAHLDNKGLDENVCEILLLKQFFCS